MSSEPKMNLSERQGVGERICVRVGSTLLNTWASVSVGVGVGVSAATTRANTGGGRDEFERENESCCKANGCRNL
jgi:hypothetical protein